MLVPIKLFVALSVLWAVAALAVQVLAGRGGGREDYSRPTGSSARGIVHSFTVAMTPRHKESVSGHPAKFAVGVVMHIGVILSLLAAVILLVWPTVGYAALSLGRPLIATSLVAGLYLLIRRILSRDLRAMSAPDDYIAMLATCGLLALACVYTGDAWSEAVYLIYAGLLFAYLPLGKLRHAVFFFVARADHGRRLGRRGVYPPAAAGAG